MHQGAKVAVCMKVGQKWWKKWTDNNEITTDGGF